MGERTVRTDQIKYRSFATERIPGLKVHIGLVGYGNIGIVHKDVLTRPQQQGFKLVGIADPHPKTKEGLKNFPFYNSLHELLREPLVQAISITTPPDSHYDLCLQAIKAGKHVATEKPPALRVEDVLSLQREAEKRGLTFITTYHARHGASVSEAHDLLRGQKIKEVNMSYSENVGDYHDLETGWVLKKNRNGGGVFMDSGINALSVVAAVIPDQFIDPHVTSAQFSRPEGYINPASGRIVNFEAETRARVEFSFGEGGKGTVQQEWLAEGPARRVVEFITENDDRYEVDIIRKTVSRNDLIIFDANASDLTRVDRIGEYTEVYNDFATHIAQRRSFVDTTPLEVVQQAYQLSPNINNVPVQVYRAESIMPQVTERVLTIARMHGNLAKERIEPTVDSLGTHASQFGPVLIVSNNTYSHKDAVADTVTNTSDPLMIDIYNGKGNDHGGMFNCGIESVHQLGLPYFATISNDLVRYIPQVFPLMLARLDADPELTTVGVAIHGVHDTDLITAINNGEDTVTPFNYAEVFPNHAFSVHRAQPISGGKKLTTEDRRFLQHQRTDGELLGRHEDIEIALRLLGKGYPLKTLLLAGNVTLTRNPAEEVPSAPDKRQTRQPTGDFYQQYYGVTNLELQRYLDNHFKIEPTS